MLRLFLTSIIFVISSVAAMSQGTVLRSVDVATADDGSVVIANRAARSIDIFAGADFSKKPVTVLLDAMPTSVAAMGDKLFVTTFESGKSGALSVVDLKGQKIEKTVDAPYGATAVTVHDGKVYVAGQFSTTVDEFDAQTLARQRSVRVLREPKAIAGGDKYIFVANFLPAQRADLDYVAAEVSVIDRQTFKIVKSIKLSNGSNALRDMIISDDGRYVLVSHNLGRYTVPTTQLQQGWMNTSAVSVIDARTLELKGAVIVDEPNRGAAGTWSLVQAGDRLVVSHSGTHDVSVIDFTKFIEKLNSYKGGVDMLDYDLRFLYGIRTRVPLGGNGPRAMAVSGDRSKVYVPTYFADVVNVLDLTDNSVESVALNPSGKETLGQTGERIFNDASYCFQNWQSCNGCHPGDARTDGMNWDLQNDGIGNSKNCKSLLYSIQTPPSMISGIRTTAMLANRKGFTHIQFSNIDEADALAVDEYTRTLEALPSPYLVDGKLSEKAEKGRAVFEKFGCGDCHSGPYYTDLKMYRIGDNVEFDNGWDTPTLREVWRTAPYLFDGRAATMRDVFAVHKHGIDKKISDKEIDELTEYVNSL